MLPEPYYQEDGITIYHGDCRDILPHLPKFDLLLTDPPYGIGRDSQPKTTGKKGGRKEYKNKNWDKVTPSKKLLRLAIEKGADQVIWGANYFPSVLTGSMRWLVWDKGQRIDQSDGELAFTSQNFALRIFTLDRNSLKLDGAKHPTQKPIKLMSWCLEFFPQAQTVLDPFMGSGTTLVAAKMRGLKAVGIEREKEYCDIAIERLAQGVLFGGDQ